MSSACTCHIDPEYCWWCLYEKEKTENARLREALEFYAESEKHIDPYAYGEFGEKARQALGKEKLK